MRRQTLIMNNWKFTYEKDGSTSIVNLPHTWNNIDGADGGNDYFRGTCTYEKDLEIPNYDKDNEDVYLVFDGVNASAKIIFNGEKIAAHNGGYSTFRVNITPYLKTKNNLKVIVDNLKTDKVYPQNADFTFYGGIYREVSILVVNKKRFDLDFFGGPGIKYYTEVKENISKVFVKTYTNESNVEISLYENDGTLIEVKHGQAATFEIEDAHLWNGVKDPYLYKVVARIMDGKTILDEVSCNVGIRYFRFDSKHGFFLNGKSYPLHGVSRHQDRKGLGNAISLEMHEEDISHILEVGANTVRLAHYQHHQHFYDLCDEKGLVVWAEIPYISEHMVNGRENTISQMKELIIQNYNHPSIVTWGISNEITIKDKHRKDMLENHHLLQNLCHELDPHRPTSLACFAMCTPFHPVSKITDLVGWNLYLGWYVPFKFLNDLWISFFHFIRPNDCLCYSEYGAEGMPNLHSKHPRIGDHSEEYQAIYHEFMLKCFARHPYMWGHYVWNMYDFAADARNQGGEPGMNHKGLMTYDRKTKKDSFYIYQAYWTDKPMLHLCSKRFINRTGNKTLIKAYSNLDEVSLYVDDKLVKTKKGNKVFKFKIKLNETTKVKVVAGDLSDEVVLHKVAKADPNYRLKATDSKNWM